MKRYLLPLLLTFLSMASGMSLYADTTYRLIDQSTGTLTGDLKFENSSSITTSSATIEGEDFNYYVKTSATIANATAAGGQFLKLIGYDCKTTSTSIKVYVKNSNSTNTRDVNISEIKEGETSETHKVKTVIAKSGSQMIERELTNEVNSTVFFMFHIDLEIYQIEITESGTPLLRGGAPGYNLNFAKGRGNFGNKSAAVIESIDGITAYLNANYSPVNTAYATINNGAYIKFPLFVQTKVSIGITSEGMNNIQNRTFCISDVEGDKNRITYDANITSLDTILSAGTYYIYGKNSDVRITYLSFEAVESSVATPENFAVSASGEVTFDAVENATRYKFTMYDDDDESVLIQQNVSSGETITRPFKKGGNYKVTLVAYIDSDASEAAEATWTLSDQSTAVGDLEESEYCSFEIGSGNSLAAMTWETVNGNVVIAISGDGAAWRGTAFRGIEYFTVGNLPASHFFEVDYTTGSTLYTLKKKTGKNIALGEVIQYVGRTQWSTANDNNAYYGTNQTYTYTYGTSCNVPDVLTTYTLSCAEGEIPVGGNASLSITSLNQNGMSMDVTTEYTISPADAGSITDGVFTATKKGLVTITATAQKDQADKKSDNIEIFVYDDTQLISVGAETEGSRGAIDGYAANSPSLVVDGIANSYWQGYSAQTNPNQETFDAWIIIDLNKIYDVDYIQVCFTGGSSSRKYHLDFSSDKTNWVTAYSYDQAGGGRDRKDHWYTNTTNNKEVRYIRFFSTEANETYGLRVGEIYVYGELSADTEAPVMGSATYSDVTTNSVVLSVSATDNTTIAGYRLKGDKTGDYAATEGSFTVDGLLSGKAYTIRVYAIDQAGNESDNYMTISFTTEGGAAPEEDTNLALGKTALAGSTEGANVAGNAVDGNTTTKWGNYENNGELLDPETNWWQVDLGKAYTLDSVKITWQHYPNHNGIVLRGSFDGSNWFDIIEYTGVNFSKGTTQTIDLSELPVTRYVRIANRAGEGSSKWYMSFYEFEVYGTGGTYVMNLTEDSDNSANITEFNNATVVATLDRSFLAGTDWYTLCLPFDMSDSQLKATFGDAYRLGKLVGSYWKGAESLFLEFDYVNHLEAGMPYVMRPSKDAVIPVISNVVVNAAAPIENRQGTAATMVGIYGPYQIPSDYYFLGANNYLLQNNNGSSMRGFRAYFKFEQQLPSNARARIVMRSDQTTIATSLEQTIKPVQAEKFFQNGQLLIRKNGTIYTVLGIKAE